MPQEANMKALLAACLPYVRNSGELALSQYEDWESEFYLDPRVKDAVKRINQLLGDIDEALSTRH